MRKRLLFSLLTTLLTPLAFAQTISSNSPLCTDNSPTLELKASGGSTYAWTGPNNFTSNQQNPTISKATASNTGTYTCVVDGKTSLTTGVKVGKAIYSFYAYNVIEGARLRIGASFDYNSNINLSWTGPNNFKSTKSLDYINGVSKINAGTYTVSAKDEFGCVSTASTKVEISDCPYAPLTYISSKSGQGSGIAGISTIGVCKGSEISINVDTTYWGKGWEIRWFKGTNIITNAVSNKFPTKELATFQAQISKSTCAYKSAQVTLVESNFVSPYIFTTAEKNLICNKQGKTTLFASFNGLDIFTDEIPKYQWYKNGEIIPETNSEQFAIYNHSQYFATESGDYQFKVKAAQCEAISEPFTIKAVDNPRPLFSFYTGGNSNDKRKNIKLCSANTSPLSIIVRGEGKHKLYKNGQQWQDLSVDGNFYNNTFPAIQQSGTYVLETKNGECFSRDTLKLEYGNVTDIILNKNEYPYCNFAINYSTDYNSFPDDGNIKWYKNNVFYSIFNPLSPNSNATYQAKYENSVTGCKGESEKINVILPTGSSRRYFNIARPTSKKITLCKSLKSSQTISIMSDRYEDKGVWKKDGKNYDIRGWFATSVSQAGKYWYEYTNGQCTFYSDTVEVIEEDIAPITISQSCTKDNVVKLSASKISGVKYNWYQNGVSIASKDSVLFAPKGGKYIVEAFRNSCVTSSQEVSVGTGLSIPEFTNACNGDSLKLLTKNENITTYNWAGPNNLKSNLPNLIIPKINKTNQGFYKLSATDKLGCTFVAQTQVTVNDYPAFTLPKNITACAGSDFVFNQLVSKPLTDSTETVHNYYAVAPNKNTYYDDFYLTNITSKDAGIYNLTIFGNQGGCTVKTTTELIVDASATCKSISLGNNSSKNICAEQTVEIPFKTTGTFKAGTVFRAYAEEGYFTPDDQYKTRKVVLGTGTKSPIKVSGFKSNSSYNIKVESEDGVASLGYQYVYTNYVSSNYITDANGYGRNAECTSLPLTLGYSNTYGTQQWFLNGDTLKKETNRTITATKSGKYTFIGTELSGCQASFSKDVVIGKIDKPQLYGDKINELSCFNESVYLSVPQYPNAKYTWRRDGILQTETYSSINATTAGKYTVEISKETCKASSDTVVVKQNIDKNINLSAYTYQTTDNNKELQTFIYTNYLGNGTYKYQLFKDNQLFAEGGQNGIILKDIGKYFFKISKGDCEAVSNIIDYKGVSGTTNNLDKRYLFFNGSYDYATNTVQLCDTNNIQSFYGYPSEYQSGTIITRKLTAYRNDKPLPVFSESLNIYPSLRSIDNGSYFYLYFRGAGTYYVTEEVTLKDSTKLKYRYGDMTVQVSSLINIGSKTPQNLFSCADSTLVYGNTSTPSQRPISYSWKKDGVVVKKITNTNESSSLTVKQPGTYVLETTYKGGCIANATPLKVELNKMNVQITDVPSLEICDGVPVALNSYIYGLPILDSAKTDTTKIVYQLLKDGKEQSKGFILSGQRGSAYLPLSFKEAGTYTLKAQQGKCQGTSNDLVLKTIKVPNTLNYADSVLFCQTQSVNLKTTDDATLSYLWERDGGFLKDASKATLEVKEAGIYRSLNRKASCWAYTPKVRTKILANILPTAIILTGDKEINYADTAKVSIAFTSHAPWTFKLSDGKEYTATKSPFEVSLRPQFSTNYTLTEVKNVCGTGTISGTANIKVLILSSELEEGVNLNVFPVPSKEDVSIQLVLDKPEAMEWTLNNVLGNILTSESQATKSTKHESTVSLKSLPEGVYFLRIQVGERSLIRKIVKTN
jgi:hypothetical protein